MRWAYTQPVVEKDNRQGNFDLTTGQEILATDGSRESRALYKAYKKGFEPRVGLPGGRARAGSCGAPTAFPSTWKGTGANLRLPLNPPFFFESAVTTTLPAGPDADDGLRGR